MSKNLVIYEKNPFRHFIFYGRYKEIFIENNHNNISRENKYHKKINQFYNGIEIKKSDYETSKNINKIFKKIFNLKTHKLNDPDLKDANNTFKQKNSFVCM